MHDVIPLPAKNPEAVVGYVTLQGRVEKHPWIYVDLHPDEDLFPVGQPSTLALKRLVVSLALIHESVSRLYAGVVRVDRLPKDGASGLIQLMLKPQVCAISNGERPVPGMDALLHRIPAYVSEVRLHWPQKHVCDRFTPEPTTSIVLPKVRQFLFEERLCAHPWDFAAIHSG